MKKDVLRNFAKFTPVTEAFSCGFCEISKKIFFQKISGRLLLNGYEI